MGRSVWTEHRPYRNLSRYPQAEYGRSADKDETAYAVLSLVAAEVRWLKRGDFVS